MGPPGCVDYASRWLKRKMPLGKARERRKTPSLVCNHSIALKELCEAEKSVIKLLQDNAFKGEIKMIQNWVIGSRELERITISSVKQNDHFVKGLVVCADWTPSSTRLAFFASAEKSNLPVFSLISSTLLSSPKGVMSLS